MENTSVECGGYIELIENREFSLSEDRQRFWSSDHNQNRRTAKFRVMSRMSKNRKFSWKNRLFCMQLVVWWFSTRLRTMGTYQWVVSSFVVLNPKNHIDNSRALFLFLITVLQGENRGHVWTPVCLRRWPYSHMDACYITCWKQWCFQPKKWEFIG